MDINYDYYRIFYYVAQYRSFTKAADVLGNNQPNITRCMNNLEQQLGCRLFVRSNKGVALTPEGMQLYKHIAAAYEQIQAGEAELAGQRALENGLISIGASETALHLLLLDSLQLFHRQYPGVRLRISNHSTPQAITALRNGLVDFSVITTPADVPKPLEAVELYPFREILLGGPQYAGYADAPHTLRELSECPFICLGEDTSTREFYRQYFAAHDLPLRVDMETATMDQVLPMLQHDLGLGFYPEELAEAALADGSVLRMNLCEPAPVRAICLVRDKSRPLSIAAARLEEMLRAK